MASLHDLRMDLRFAVRVLRRTPGFAAIVILTLALGIGANAAIFGVINSLLLRPLPVVEPHRLYSISVDSAIGRRFPSGVGWNAAMWDRFQPQQFDGAFAWMAARFDLAERGERQPAEGIFATAGYFSTLGVPALLGRTFTADDDRPGGGPDGPVAVISYRLWQRKFGGAGTVIGSRLSVDSIPVTIVGVAPPEFLGVEVGRPFDVALPLRIEPLIHRNRAVVTMNAPYLAVMVRLKADQPVDGAIAALRAQQHEIVGVSREALTTARTAPAGAANNLNERLKAPFTLNTAAYGTSGTNPFVQGLRQGYERPLFTIAIVAGLVLLIACVNIANLMLARAAARRHEMSVRLALGAPRMRIARQMLIESLLLSGAGALLGMLFASWGSRALIAQLSTSVDHITMDVSLDWRVSLFTAAVALATAAIFGTAPALRAAAAEPIEALKANARTVAAARAGAGASRRHASLTGSLVIAQVSLALALVIVAALFVRTFARTASVPLGFEPQRVLVVNVDLGRANVAPADRLAFSHRLVEAVRLSPGVSQAGASRWTPIDRGLRASDPARNLAFNHVTPGWFAAYGTAMTAGRDFDARDTAAALPVAIVNQAYVRQFVTGQPGTGGTPIGARVFGPGPRGGRPIERTIVGVVDDAVFDSQRDGTQPMAYLPLAQTVGMEPPGEPSITISLSAAAGAPMGLARSVAAALTALDGNLSFTFRPLADQVDASLTQERLIARLSGIFGALALLIAALGLYGVTSYAVQRRASEIGIRMALGAQRGDVVGLVLRQSLTLTIVGIAFGLAAAAIMTRYVRGMLFGLTPLDPATFIGVAIVFAVVATAAAAIPARRATRIDPLTALRAD